MYFLFSFRQTNSRIEVKRVVLCCCFAVGRGAEILISKVNFFYISPTSQAAKQKHEELAKE